MSQLLINKYVGELATERRCVDGALLHTLRVLFGYWEGRDEKDDLDAEIADKFKRGLGARSPPPSR